MPLGSAHLYTWVLPEGHISQAETDPPTKPSGTAQAGPLTMATRLSRLADLAKGEWPLDIGAEVCGKESRISGYPYSQHQAFSSILEAFSLVALSGVGSLRGQLICCISRKM